MPRWYKEMGIPITYVNNCVKERRPIVYPLDADGSRVRLKLVSKGAATRYDSLVRRIAIAMYIGQS